MKVILVLTLILLSFEQRIISPKQIVDELSNLTLSEDILTSSIKNLQEAIKYYAYYITSQNPPQPNNLKEYFPKIDIDHLFDNIKTKDTNLFDFKNELLKAVLSLNDIHTRTLFTHIKLDYIIYIAPIELYSVYNETSNETKMYGRLSVSDMTYPLYFRNGSYVYKTINNNINISIDTINGKDPFDFIQNFLGIKLRNPHATYTYNSYLYSKNSFNYPLTLEDLTNFEVVYDSGDSFNTDYIVLDYSNSKSNFEENKFYKDNDDENKFIEFIRRKNEKGKTMLNQDNEYLKTFDDIIIEFENKYKPKTSNMFLSPYYSNIIKEENAINWDYNYTTGTNTVFLCREDKENQVNVYKINNFAQGIDTEPSLDIIEQCAKLFDQNNYNIIIILPYNQGGNPIIGLHILELVNPYSSLRPAIRMRKFDGMGGFIEAYNNNEFFVGYNSSEHLNASYFKDGFVTEKYGEKEQTVSKPFYWKISRDRIDSIKSQLKNKRKANEIVIFTDSFSVSASSIFCKSIQKSGSGIMVGFHGNPKINKDIFDASTSPSPLAGPNYFYIIAPNIVSNMEKYGIGVQYMTAMQMHFDFQNSHDIMEYDVSIVDERINYYNAYTDNEYNYFISEGKAILEKYKEQCNPNNDMLTLYSDECKFSEESHLHGGHPCGSKGLWDKSRCVPIYCDQGYYFNRPSQKCLTEADFKIEDKKEDKSDENSNINYDFILMISFAALSGILVIIIIVLGVKLHKTKNKEKDINEKTALMNENDNSFY